jgi:hypothetical protein
MAAIKKTTGKLEKELDKTYNEFKEFEGKKYTGMKVGRSHGWNYDKGEWKEKKVAPDRWEFTYAVKKNRVGKAPEGSGVPTGTAYHWYILAHQNVTKLDANTYTTAMTGMKYKLAHKRADKENWNASDRWQRKRLVEILQEMIDSLQDGMKETETVRGVKITPMRSRTNGKNGHNGILRENRNRIRLTKNQHNLL